MAAPAAAAGGDVSLHNFSARLWEQLVHFHVMRLTDSLFLWVGATPQLRNLAVAMCTRYPGRPASRCLSATTFQTPTAASHCWSKTGSRRKWRPFRRSSSQGGSEDAGLVHRDV
ncbi:proteasome assembly chaperone 4 isoform X2 [Hippopotamus amphibius kiboko]|uniref:proteasome assembly chaperone 4 isoform X2 n=1 Tax=Hippopotamus amphibius kiboko TaxID=575201 RepID=UPI002598C3D0|nr:proteasome assembly chaperone 4 isoform X2 [Hippopotamus amphibius kiboko]